MPVYEYKCQRCGKTSEIFQQVDEKVVCPACGSPHLTKLISTPASIRMGDSSSKGTTCCGREERCDTPPCSTGGVCRRD